LANIINEDQAAKSVTVIDRTSFRLNVQGELRCLFTVPSVELGLKILL